MGMKQLIKNYRVNWVQHILITRENYTKENHIYTDETITYRKLHGCSIGVILFENNFASARKALHCCPSQNSHRKIGLHVLYSSDPHNLPPNTTATSSTHIRQQQHNRVPYPSLNYTS
jgi:hypothetical protein